MEKFNQISELVLPAPEFADFAVRAAAAGVSLPYYLGVLCLTGAYGFAHPEVRAFLSRPTPGICGPVIEGGP